MDQATFKKSFPAFPTDVEAMEKLCRLLINENIVNHAIWEELTTANPDPKNFIESLASLDAIAPRRPFQANSSM